ncbi:tyrosine-type recombinase/integrase [Fictibacillus barbaricus]|uniref:Tyrosine-type recombinase/integrase n=1 Tax=Fictibacillus barbaricus TaxID=182136 RepID=A0ABS2Z9M6_9BACL|nr:tyrosine-type recombinase/integrase [Fictibacillus barbaricus]MBN3544131.1 tyrosine-type recombinase/integrase [Fictibacillus barbaricus]GGB69169.1 tyrosine recombinase XerD [Fictibacillus barbaricus]
MNLIKVVNQLSSNEYLQILKSDLEKKQLLDENRNLNFSQASEKDLIEWFFAVKIQKAEDELSPHTLKAYRSDAKTLLHFLSEQQLSFKDIGYPEVKAYNRYIKERYAAKSAVRKLEFFRRLLDFGYETRFYKAHLSIWIEKPKIRRGHVLYEENKNRVQLRELNQKDAEVILSFFPKVVRAKKYQEQLQQRNLLIGYFLYTLGLRASEITNLNWGSFKNDRRGNLWADVIGKGKKHREVPVREETADQLFYYRTLLGQSIEINPYDETPLFYSLYNKEETRQRLSYITLYKIVKEAVRLAGKHEKISPHWYRHTFVTTMLENDIPLTDVKEWVGHSDISTTNIYLGRINKERSYEQLKKAKLF